LALDHQGVESMPEHKDRPPTALAHGSAKSSDIERVRRDVDGAKLCVENAEQASAARGRRRRSRKAAAKRAEQS
jgi:hypothetical protein